MMLLLGRFTDGKGEQLSPQTRQRYEDKFTESLAHIKCRVGDEAGRIFTGFPEEVFRKFVDSTFSFPFHIAGASIHTAHASVDGRYWLHLHVFSAIDSDDPKPFGQVTLTTDKAGATLQCPVKEVFFSPDQVSS